MSHLRYEDITPTPLLTLCEPNRSICYAPVNDTAKSQNDTVNDTVFSLIKQDNKMTANEISESLKMSLSTVRRKIKELRDNGKVERIGSDKTGYWRIIG